MFALLSSGAGVAHGDRLELPVVLTGDQLPLWSGKPVADVYALVFEANAQTWAPIPYQIDERVWRDLATCLDDPAYGNVDPHLSYAFDAAEGNGLDIDDEIVFLAGDAAGDRAQPSDWPAGTDDTRYEVRIDDGLGATLGYAYLFTAATPPTPPDVTDYVDLSFTPIDETLEDTAIATDRYTAHYSGRWRLDALAVPPAAGGSGADLIDRLKFREATSGNATGGETEETWDRLSCLLGQKDGPVRVLREVQGVASGVNTTHTLSFYGALFEDRVNLRVHAIPNVVSFVDYDASVATGGLLTYYNPTNALGVTIDGVADPGLDTTLHDWEMVSHPSAGARKRDLAGRRGRGCCRCCSGRGSAGWGTRARFLAGPRSRVETSRVTVYSRCDERTPRLDPPPVGEPGLPLRFVLPIESRNSRAVLLDPVAKGSRLQRIPDDGHRGHRLLADQPLHVRGSAQRNPVVVRHF
jgi:hypothetical protein